MTLNGTTTPTMTARSQPRIAWEDRWTEPELEQLLEPIEEARRKLIQSVIDQAEAFDGVETSIAWYGEPWKWTLQFDLTLEDQSTLLAFVVPKPEAPLVSIPLKRDTIEKLPLRRLSKFIRDGIKIAKYAADTHWGVWTPIQPSEVEQLVDLIKRKHKILRTGAADQGE